MASVRSLGLHRPSAIPFLVAESLLPPDPSEEEYTWQTGIVDDGPEGPADEEIVYTRTCVVWSRGGIVKKVYRFDLEKEEIRHVLFTYFPNLQSEGRADEAEDIASQLGREFGDIGAPLKTSRRVSSLLARADLATSQDKATFSDLAIGNQTSSAPYGGARHNNGSFLDAPVDRVLEELKNGSDPKCLENFGLQESMSALPLNRRLSGDIEYLLCAPMKQRVCEMETVLR
ncbi:hypothetical protein VTN00DRAFT_7296 [Thermoascus crustaceus]|uniref:uncharacterized protein n=1 Tax=Thermoascus crustaceus TaxID=5088 RepID=UPI0037420623